MRCSPAETKRGQRAVRQPAVVSTPRTSDAVRSSRATTPVPRVRTRSVFAFEAAAAVRRSRCHRLGGPPAGEARRAVLANEARGQSLLLEPAGCGVAEHEGGGRGGVRGEAASGGDGDGSPRVSAGLPVRGSITWCAMPCSVRQRRTAVPDVARPPSAIATTGPACRGGGVVVGDADGPARRRRRPRDGDVAAERDQHARAVTCGGRPGGSVRRPGLRGRAEVELEPAGDVSSSRSRSSSMSRQVARRGATGPQRPRAACADERERPVVAGRP